MAVSKNKWECPKCKPQCVSNLSQNYSSSEEFKLFDDCSVCCKTVTNNMSINCSLCLHWVHAKCLGKFNGKTFSEFSHFYQGIDWYCPSCLSDSLPFFCQSDIDFKLTCLEMSQNMNFNTTELERKCRELVSVDMFDSILLSNKINDMATDDNIKHFDAIDPDAHFNRQNIKCEYLFDLKNIKLNKKSFSVLTLNIRSIRNKFVEFETLLASFSSQVDIITITETWLSVDDNVNDYTLTNYHPPIVSNRKSKNSLGGGVMTYIHKSIPEFRENRKLSFHDDKIHLQVVDFSLESGNNKKSSVINCYRSPNSDIDHFNKRLDQILKSYANKNCYLAGDFNLNLLNISDHQKTDDFYSTCLQNTFQPLITKPTRITNSSKTLIDNIFTNDINSNVKSYIYVTDISDHLPCISVFDNKSKDKGYIHQITRNFSDSNMEKFRTQLNDNLKNKVDDICSDNPENTQNQYDIFFTILTNTYELCFPTKRKKIHTKTYSKPWITNEIQKKIVKRNKLFSQKLTNSNANSKYKLLKKEIDQELKH